MAILSHAANGRKVKKGKGRGMTMLIVTSFGPSFSQAHHNGHLLGMSLQLSCG